jgi:hypothetical protein
MLVRVSLTVRLAHTVLGEGGQCANRPAMRNPYKKKLAFLITQRIFVINKNLKVHIINKYEDLRFINLNYFLSFSPKYIVIICALPSLTQYRKGLGEEVLAERLSDLDTPN